MMSHGVFHDIHLHLHSLYGCHRPRGENDREAPPEGALRIALGADLETEGALRIALGADLEIDGALRIVLVLGALLWMLGALYDAEDRGEEPDEGALRKLRGLTDGFEDEPPMVTERFGAMLRDGVRIVADGADCTEGTDVVGAPMFRERVLGVLVAELRGVEVIDEVPVVMLRLGGVMPCGVRTGP